MCSKESEPEKVNIYMKISKFTAMLLKASLQSSFVKLKVTTLRVNYLLGYYKIYLKATATSM